MNINVIGNWWIVSEAQNFVLKKRGEGKINDETFEITYPWSRVMYFSNFEHALQRVVREMMRDSDCSSLQEVIDLINQLRRDLFIQYSDEILNVERAISNE